MNRINQLSRCFVAALLLFGTAIGASAQDDDYYFNPVLDKDFPDPTVVRAPDGTFYAFATGRTVQRYSSTDLVHWKRKSDAFTEGSRPKINTGSVWAPDINYVDGKYVMYYSQSEWGGEWTCGIGVATCDTPDGKFTDQGKLFTSQEIGVQNSIDPFYYEMEDGSKYLFWGSFRDIYAIQLSDDGMAVKEGAQKKKIAGGLTEGTYIYKRGEYYYLFGSAGSCCDGLNSTYRLVVARSKNLLGPYTSKSGGTTINNSFSEVLHRGNGVVGPGHCSEIIEDDLGQTWIMYHGYKEEDVNRGRCMFLDQVQWDSNGWPYIVADKPSHGCDAPVFGTKAEYTYSDVDYIEFSGEDENYTYLFDTGYVPNISTVVELDCHTYAENDFGELSAGRWRALFSGRNNNGEGISFYVNNKGNQWGYFVGGYINDFVGKHEYETDYHIKAQLSSVTINGEEYNTNRTSYTATTKRLTLFSGINDYPYFGRIYRAKIYEDDTLIHDYKPKLRNEDELVVFYDAVTGSYVRPSNIGAFGYGSIIDAIQNVNADADVDGNVYDITGRRVNNTDGHGLYIVNGKKIIK